MHITGKISIVSLIALMIFSCNTPDSTRKIDDSAILLKLHEDSRKAHFGKNAQAMIDLMNDSMISVNAGFIHRPDKKRDAEGFQAYFDAVEFKKWDDVKPPVIRFADDHSIAYMVVDKEVVLHTKDSVGKPVEESVHYAWLSIYRKQQDGNWKLECIASTNQPELKKPIE